MPILTSADYPSIRALLDVSFIDAAWPSDEVIEMPIFLAEALRLLTLWAPDAVASIDTETMAGVKTAAIYLVAALIAPSVPQLKSETEGGYSYTVQAVDWSVRSAELRALARATLEVFITPADRPVVRHSSFRVLPACRPLWY